MKKRIMCLMVICLMLVQTVGIGFADTVTFKTTRGTKICQNPWERTVDIYESDDCLTLVATMIYGFDTVGIDEDYTWTQSLSYSNQAVVYNEDKGTCYGSIKKDSSYSKIEVTHKGYKQEYRIKLYNVTASDKASFYMSDEYKSSVK